MDLGESYEWIKDWSIFIIRAHIIIYIAILFTYTGQTEIIPLNIQNTVQTQLDIVMQYFITS